MSIARRRFVTGTALASVLAAASCAPGGSGTDEAPTSLAPASTDLGDEEITLTVWDQNTDGGIDDAQNELNDAFMAEYPSITIERTSRSFADLKTTLRLALSGSTPPDVIQANQGYPDMGAFVAAGYLRSLNDYADLYGWRDAFPAGLLALNSFSADGTTWQGDELYGPSQTGELVGVYANTAVLEDAGITELPTSVEELTAALQTLQDAGVQPMSFGNVEKSPGIHILGVVLTALAGRDTVNDLVTSSAGAWTDPVVLEAATTIQGWQESGFLTEGANGVSRDAAVSDVAEGRAGFTITGTWYQATFEAAENAEDIRFTALVPPGADGPETMGGVGLAWAVTAKSPNPDAAAAYIDFITNRAAAETLVGTGNLPAVVPDDVDPATTVGTDITERYEAISTADGLSPYLDYATPTFYDTLTAAMQDLIAGQKTPEEFTAALQTDYEAFAETR